MPITTVNLSLKGLLEDLDNGLTWYKKDDLGYGSIQEKYKAKDMDIAKLRLDPRLKNAEPNVTIFKLIDDTNEREYSENTNGGSKGKAKQVSEVSKSDTTGSNTENVRSGELKTTTNNTGTTTRNISGSSSNSDSNAESFSAFASL